MRRQACDLVLLVCAALAAYAVLSPHPILGSYSRYVLAAREMALGGDWVVPHLGGVAYFEKPILLFWAAAACRQLFGDSSVAVSLPSGLASLLSVVCTYEFGRELHGRLFGLFAGLLLLLSAEFLVMTTMLTADPLFAGWLAVALLAYYKHDLGRGSWWVWILWASVGLAWLTKGPLGLVIPALGIGGHAVMTGGIRGASSTLERLKTIRGLSLVLAINLPWHLLVWLRDPRYLEMFYLHINLRGLFDPSINHGGAPYYYLTVLALALFPWTLPGLAVLGSCLWTNLAAPSSLRHRARENPADLSAVDNGRLYLSSAVVLPLLLLSISASKLYTYILPILPAVLLLVADSLWEVANKPPRWLRHACSLQAVIFGLSACGVFLARDAIVGIDRYGWSWLSAGALILIAGSIACAIAVLRGRVLPGFLLSGSCMFVATAVLLPNADRIMPGMYGGDLAHTALASSGPEDLFIVDQATVQDYTIPLILGRRLAILDRARELGMGHFTEVTGHHRPLPEDPYLVSAADLPENEWLYTWQRLDDEWNGPRRIWLFGYWNPDHSKDAAARLRSMGLEVYSLGHSREVQLVSNKPVGREE